MGVRLVVTDLDGTLWDAEGEVHPATRRALRLLADDGVPVIAATARRRASVRHAARRQRLRLGGVLIDGALGYEDLDGEPFHTQPFTDDQVCAVLDVFARYGHEPMFETDDATHDVIAGAQPSIPPAYFDTNPALQCDLAEPLPLPVFSAIAIVERAVADDVLAAIVAARVGAGWIETNPAFPETANIKVRSPHCTKWSTVAAYCTIVGLQPSEVVAIGNDDNDVELLREAGVGLAVATASPAALAAADHVVPPPDQGGWAHILDFR